MQNLSPSFKEGRYFDLWMLVHLLCGVTGGFSNVLFGLTERNVFLVGIGMMLLWELGEHAVGIRESLENRTLDIVVGLAGVFVALRIAARIDPVSEHWALAVSAFLFGLGSLLGWIAHRRRRRVSPAGPA